MVSHYAFQLWTASVLTATMLYLQVPPEICLPFTFTVFTVNYQPHVQKASDDEV